jgi:hypothetical protein
MEAESGPGLWYYPVQFGGVHPVVVPFKNFGIFGVTAIMLLFGWIIGRVEVMGRAGGMVRRFVYATFFVASFNWFWYGDMPMIRALMALAGFAVLHQVLVAVRLTAPHGATPARTGTA